MDNKLTPRSAGWICDPMNHALGRRNVIFIAAFFSLLSPIGQAVTQNYRELIACRILLGIGVSLLSERLLRVERAIVYVPFIFFWFGQQRYRLTGIRRWV